MLDSPLAQQLNRTVMVNTTATGAPLLTAAQVSELLIQPIIAESIATQVSRVVLTNTNAYRVPIITDDPAASWIAEGSEIPVDDLGIDELVILAHKLVGLSFVTNELLADSGPDAAAEVGRGIARDIARKLDAAYFGASIANGPSGLAGLSGVQAVDAGDDFDGLDWADEALMLAETVGATVGAFVTSPATALKLAKLKAGTGSNVKLLGSDPTAPTKRLISGVPLYVSSAVGAGTVWGIPADRAVVTLREDATVETDKSVAFTSDRTAVRCKTRVGVGFPHPQAVVKVSTTP
ncbi:MAG: phage major capsid protein [Rhodococcus sp. (in: high G+C Gram-positive bacteria)]|nr:phage major capsid protein [Rhodococcus sp. (in: high G+C Gram-positive bacteria)]MDI6627252.1 phage major capsid protein [Rhodococcus sp. (in: high G+C Gram-positive bacteria)]